MKPIVISAIEHQLARHDSRAGSNRQFPAIACFLRPQPDVMPGRARHYPGGDPARRAFRRMTAKMMASQNRRDPLETIVFAIVIAIWAWSLVDLLIVLV